jgi:hydroxymethylglutaryl-CoA lyase
MDLLSPEPDVIIREVGLRDGLQSIEQIMATSDKLAWCDSEYNAGVREIEVSSLVPPALLPQLADAPEVIEHALSLTGLVVAALIPNLKGAVRGIALGAHKLTYVMSVSERHNQANVRRSRAESIDDFTRIAELINHTTALNGPLLVGGLSTAFGCTLEGAIDTNEVERLAVALVEAGADELVIADTVGYADPRAVKKMFAAVSQAIGNAIPIAAHFHDTRGLGLANVLAALDVGIRAFDASLAGLGGCPHAPGATGNIVTEDLVFMCESMGLSTGIDLEKLLATRDILSRGLTDVTLLGDVAKAGLLPNGTYLSFTGN